MKNISYSSMLVLLIGAVHSQLTPLTPSDYNLKCATCAHVSNSTFYYCTKDDTCRNSTDDFSSCEQGLAACLSYRAVDLGVKEIVPFTVSRASFKYTVTPEKAVRFALSNQDSKTKGWFKVMMKTAPTEPDDGVSDNAEDTTEIIDIRHQILDTLPEGIFIKYFDQNTGSLKTDYVYSKTGKAYLKPLNTRFLYVYATGSATATVQVMYGNTKWAKMVEMMGGVVMMMMLIYSLI